MPSVILTKMKLIAQHADGFTEHLLQWTLTAEHGVATISARWFDDETGQSRTFQIPFTDARIADVADLIRGLKPQYEGTTDDFPDYRLSVTTETECLQTHVYESIGWDEDVASDVGRFHRAWDPIASMVERALALPGRHCTGG